MAAVCVRLTLALARAMSAVMAAPMSPFAQKRCGSPLPRPSPMHAIETFEDIIVASRARVAQWGKDRIQAAHLEAQQGFRDLHREHLHLEDFQEELVNVNDLAQAVSTLRDESCRLGHTLAQSSDATSERARVLLNVKEQLLRANDMKLKELHEQKQALAAQQCDATALHGEVDRFLALYRDRLALKITRSAPHTVRMAFTLIDDSQPSQEYAFTLGLQDRGTDEATPSALLGAPTYRVSRCYPPVPELHGLLDSLNMNAGSPHALPAFVCGMRQAFKRFAGSSIA